MAKLSFYICDLDLWPWPFTWTTLLSLAIIPENFMMIRCRNRVKRWDGRTEGRTDRTIDRAWSQLKINRRACPSIWHSRVPETDKIPDELVIPIQMPHRIDRWHRVLSPFQLTTDGTLGNTSRIHTQICIPNTLPLDVDALTSQSCLHTLTTHRSVSLKYRLYHGVQFVIGYIAVAIAKQYIVFSAIKV